MFLHIDNPFAHKSEAPTVATPEATEQNPEINADTAKQVAELGLKAVQSQVEVKAPEATIPVQEWDAADKELAKASAFGMDVEQDTQPEAFGNDFKIPESAPEASKWDKTDEELAKASAFGMEVEQDESPKEFEPDFKVVDTTIETPVSETTPEKVNS